jgi:DNA repair exonuclease SbcCD nuclease subunit
LAKRPLAAPVIYPGSIERTSFAERDEAKGYQIVSFETNESRRGSLTEVAFELLPARPMVSLVIEPEKLRGDSLSDHVRAQVAALAPDSVVRIQLLGPGSLKARTILSAAHLRALAPPSMNITLAPERAQFRRPQK